MSGIEVVIDAYKNQPHTPNMVTDFWSSLLSEQGGLESPLKQCIYSTAELASQRDRGLIALANPIYLARSDDLEKLYNMLPEIVTYMVTNYITGEQRPVENGPFVPEWGTVELALEAPNRRKLEDEVEPLLNSLKRQGQTVNNNILASKAAEILLGSPMDSFLTWSRLPGSVDQGQSVRVFHDLRGRMSIFRGTVTTDREKYTMLGIRTIGEE